MIKIRCTNCDGIFEVEDDKENAVCPECGMDQELDMDQIVFDEESIASEDVEEKLKKEPEKPKEQKKIAYLDRLIQEAEECMKNGEYGDANWKFIEIQNRDPEIKQKDYRVAWGSAFCQAITQLESMKQADPEEETFQRLYGRLKTAETLKTVVDGAPEENQGELSRQYQELVTEYQDVYQKKMETVRLKQIQKEIDAAVINAGTVLEKLDRLKILAGKYPSAVDICTQRAEQIRLQYQENFHVMDAKTEEELRIAEIMYAGNEKMQESIKLRREMLREKEALYEKNVYREAYNRLNQEKAHQENFKDDMPNKKPDERMIWNQTIADMMYCYKQYYNADKRGLSFADELDGNAFESQYRIRCMELNFEPGDMGEEVRRLKEWGNVIPKEKKVSKPEMPLGEATLKKEFYHEKPGQRALIKAAIFGIGFYTIDKIAFYIIGLFISIFSTAFGVAVIRFGQTVGALGLILPFILFWNQYKYVFMNEERYVATRLREMKKVNVRRAEEKRVQEEEEKILLIDGEERYHIKKKG